MADDVDADVVLVEVVVEEDALNVDGERTFGAEGMLMRRQPTHRRIHVLRRRDVDVLRQGDIDDRHYQN